jgi:hypothetical protein
MADVKISALPASTTPLAGTETVPLVQSAVTKKVSVENLTAGRQVAMSSILTGTWTTNGSFTRNLQWDGAQFYQADDGISLLGFPSFRWNTVYAVTGTINTSDGDEKQDIATLNAVEKRVAARLKTLVKKFRFKDAVVQKGDNARIHVGWIAQEVQSAFESEGLNSSKYGLFCSDTWYEVDGNAIDDDGAFYTKESDGAVEKTRLGLRYEELLAFVISAS